MAQDEIIAVREIYWNIHPLFGPLVIYTLAIITTIVMTWGIMRDIRRWRRGRPELRIDQLGARSREFLVQAFGQKKVLRERRPGLCTL